MVTRTQKKIKPHKKNNIGNLSLSGILILNRKVLKYIKPNKFQDLSKNILPKLLKKKCKKPIFSDGGVSSGILKRIYLARKIINTSAIISYGDTLAKINFKDLLEQHKKSKAILSIVVAPIILEVIKGCWVTKAKAI